MSESPALFDEDIYEASPGPSRARVSRTANASMPPSPAASTSSDKENRLSRSVDKGKSRTPMGPPSASTSSAQPKRKRAAEVAERNQRRRTVEVAEDEDEPNGDQYDPDQDVEQRREVRKGYREENRKLQANRAEYMNPRSTGLIDTLKAANTLSNNVKQTSEATVDSRLLVNVADLAYKKTLAVVSGDTSQGVDIEDFISRCKTYMKNAEGALESSTQRRRAAAGDDEEDNGDALNWEHFGRHACSAYIARPSVPGFLLGPLSLEKRARKTTVRKVALRLNSLKETQPEKVDDIQRNENENLTSLCHQIQCRLEKLIVDGEEAVDDELRDGMTAQEERELAFKHGVKPGDTPGLAYFKFVINPDSFGQSVENLFYVSFLIRDGKIGITFDDDGMPFLCKSLD